MSRASRVCALPANALHSAACTPGLLTGGGNSPRTPSRHKLLSRLGALSSRAPHRHACDTRRPVCFRTLAEKFERPRIGARFATRGQSQLRNRCCPCELAEGVNGDCHDGLIWPFLGGIPLYGRNCHFAGYHLFWAYSRCEKCDGAIATGAARSDHFGP